MKEVIVHLTYDSMYTFTIATCTIVIIASIYIVPSCINVPTNLHATMIYTIPTSSCIECACTSSLYLCLVYFVSLCLPTNVFKVGNISLEVEPPLALMSLYKGNKREKTIVVTTLQWPMDPILPKWTMD